VSPKSRILVTGACGFIGGALGRRLLAEGHEVIGIDNLSRKGTETNATELQRLGLQLHQIDLADSTLARAAIAAAAPFDALFHLAGQVAVTTSYADPVRDFRDNAQASFNVIDAVRACSPRAYCLYASTNKVYGRLHVNEPVGLDYPLNPYTPYGISKAVGELYFAEYGRPEIGLTTCCLRQSCIFGDRQWGVEDQGWVAWFAIANAFGIPITIFGDGSQVRDLLFIDDLVDLYLEAWTKRLAGVYPVGGGASNKISLRESLDLISQVSGRPFAEIRYEAARPGDQPYFVADISWAKSAGLDWRPRVTIEAGLRRMISWIESNEPAIRDMLARRSRL
jgi:CDP-paratose 2-epimerase